MENVPKEFEYGKKNIISVDARSAGKEANVTCKISSEITEK
jgi:hypothetical protein